MYVLGFKPYYRPSRRAIIRNIIEQLDCFQEKSLLHILLIKIKNPTDQRSPSKHYSNLNLWHTLLRTNIKVK